MAAKAGLDIEQRDVFPRRSNILMSLRPSGKIHQRVILAPHMDTVGHDQMPDSLFRPAQRGDRLHGRGACDTKGSIAAMFSALAEVASSEARPKKTEIVLAALIDEENFQAGSRALVKERYRGNLAIVGEPTRIAVITAHKGDLWLTLRTRGKAAHGACPALGRNAVHEMARIVDLIQTEYARRIARRRHPLLGTPTVNVGAIRGGTQPNIVPDLCEISVDRRTLPGESEAEVRREIARLVRRRKLNAEVLDQKGAAACWPMETDPAIPLVRQLMDATGQRDPQGVHYFSDAAVFAHGGTPAVLFGPGDIAQAHTVNEWISVRSLHRATALLTKFLRSLP
jgi:acetylornithine deacetylase/succinyl-diaminopimelate desuccinylase-like protein